MGHKIQGLKNLKESYCPEIFDKDRLDEKVNIDDEEAFETTRRLAREEGLFVGMSSGAAMAVAVRQARLLKEGTLVVILPDGGERYLSTPLFTAPEKVAIRLFDTMKRGKEVLETQQPGKVSIYSCGPTAYASLHLGQCRRYVFADLLCRYLMYRGYEVRHLVNITDFDDKTIQGSEKAGQSIEDFTRHHIEGFKQDMAHLRIRPADSYPLASAHIDDMVQLARKLVQKGFAYEKLRSLYFDISRLKDYGRLSGIDLDKIRLGHTVDLDEYEKDNPRDFTLLKRARLSELKRGLFTKTEWGNVRPSWHIQCVAMATKYLGETIDIHTGGSELVFPHHENEIAIAAAISGKPLANYWLHCEGVRLADNADAGDALPQALGDVMQSGFSGRTIRFWLLATHHRKPLVYSHDRLTNAALSLKRLDACIRNLHDVRAGSAYPELNQLLYDIRNGFTQAMDDDLNISGALAAVFSIVRRINRLLQNDSLNGDDAAQLIEAFRQVDRVLDIFDFEAPPSQDDVQDLVERREVARAAKDWATADRIREELLARGVSVKDRKL
jgi:cysteinyl-tRNA synthetase